MRDRWAPSFAWTVAAIAVAALIASFVFGVVDDPTKALDAAWILSWLSFPVVGALIVSRRPNNGVGWVLLAIGVSITTGLVGNVYGLYAITNRLSLPGTDIALWATQLALIPAFGLVPILVLLFPTARIDSRRWRMIARLAVVDLALLVPVYAVRAFLEVGEGIRIDNRFAIPALSSLIEIVIPVLILALVAFALAVVVHAVWRFVRSRGAERQQMKWFASAVVFMPVMFGLSMSIEDSTIANVVLSISFIVGLNGVAAAIGVAVLRYRLYEIDRIVSRTLTYGLITALLGGTFALLVLVPSLVVGRAAVPDYVIAAATLIVAALFRPVRRRVQNAVDHRFNRKRYDAEHTIDAFTARLREQIDLDTLGAELRDVVAGTMHPAHVSLWVRPPARSPVAGP